MNMEELTIYHLVKSEDLNHHGTLFAGRGAEWLVEAGFIAAANLLPPQFILCLKIHGMEFTRPVPVFALIPLFMLWFGIGFWPQILLVALGVSAILGVETYEAIRNLPLVYIRAASNLGADKKTIFRTVVIPYIFPHLIGAIRVAAAASWGLDVAAEFMWVRVGHYSPW